MAMTIKKNTSHLNENILMQITNGGNYLRTLDFNRYNYLCFPTRHDIENGLSSITKRNISAEELFMAFKETGYSQASKFYLFEHLRQYVIFCDKYDYTIFTDESVQLYGSKLIEKNKSGLIKNTTYTTIISATKRVFILLNLPAKWFDKLPTLGKSQAEPFKAYSDHDLKKLLPLLRALFKQLSKQFLWDPESHLSLERNQTDMYFRWKGRVYPVYSGVSRLMASAAYLMSYYTWGNTTTLLSLQRPEKTTSNIKEDWYQMPAFKRRSFKIVTLQIGDHGKLNIPKYSLDLFNQLLRVSTSISESSNLLFQTASVNGITPLTTSHLANFNTFLSKHFRLTDDKSLPLSPTISRFRATGSQLMQLHYSHIQAASLLGNSPHTTRRHYSEGNEHDNHSMLQDSVSILADKAKYGESIEIAKNRIKDELKVEILTYENLLKMKSPPMRQAHGSYCNNPFGEQAERFLRRVQRHDLLTTEKFACSDLMMCFSCPHQVIVAEVTDIWSLLSFKECLEESIYKHVDHLHFHRNYDAILDAIELILKSIDKKVLAKATQKIRDKGVHPLWRDQSFLYPINKVVG
jgi:hypothetical protein